MPLMGDIHYAEEGAGRPLMLVTGLSGLKPPGPRRCRALRPTFG